MAKVEVTMPKMGESITEGTVIVWHKKVGDTIEIDEVLLEIGTDKVDTEVPSPAEGVIAEILIGEGETVDVGTIVAIINTEKDAAVEATPASAPPASETEASPEPAPTSAAPPQTGDQDSGTPAPSAAPTTAQAGSESSNGQNLVEVVMPKMGESITEGTVIAWHKAQGDMVEVDETLLEIATDKVDTEVPSPASGMVHQILVPEGESVDVGTVIARIAVGDQAAATPVAPTATPADDSPVPSRPVAKQPDPPVSPRRDAGVAGDGASYQEVEPVAAGALPRTGPSGRFYSPLVRSIASKEGVSLGELENVDGSGRDGRVTKADLLQYLDNRPAAKPRPAVAVPQTPTEEIVATTDDGRVEIIQMDRMRQIIAHHMIESKRTSAHVTSFAEVDVTNLVRLRESRKVQFAEEEGVKLTYTPFFVKAAVDALRTHRLLNSSVEETRILIKKDLHIGIAVAIGNTGLVVPVIKNAGQKNIAGLARAAAELADRARSKSLQPDDLQGGTFTVTNIGSLGSIMGTPIIAQPQVAILATGAIKKRPVVIEDDDLGDIIAIRHIMFVSLSYDHRIVDGAMAASFLHEFRESIEGYDDTTEL